MAVVLLAMDTTDRKQAERQLAIFQQFAEASPQGFAMADLEGHILYVNPEFSRLSGYELEELVGKSFVSFQPSDIQKKLQDDILPTVLREGAWQGESPFLTRSGRLLPTIQNIFLIRDEQGKPVYLATVFTEISERKAAEEALRESHGELRRSTDGMVDGLLIVDIETKRFLRANVSICRMLGYTEEELLQMSVMDIHPPEDLSEELAIFQRGVEGKLSAVGSRPVLRKDGSIFHADLHPGYRITYNGRPCLIGFFRDITERIEAEQALKQKQSALRPLGIE